ncbi:MAG: hypothetical protein Sapg2KO_53240 [Saprospiraceae bacterium]
MKKSPDCNSITKKSYLFSKNNLLLLLVFTFLVACAEKEVLETSGIFGYVYIPDENFERKLIDLGIDSKGVMDQSILRKDAYQSLSLDSCE